MKLIASANEHEEVRLFDISYQFDDTLKEKFQELYEDNDAKFLGLHVELDSSKAHLMAHYYIGYRWLNMEKDEYIAVMPKKRDNQTANYMSMFMECLNDPIASAHLEETYKIFFDEKWIEIDSSHDQMTPLLILHFLNIVKKITQKGLKKGYLKVVENLTSRIKGKILVNQTIKYNHFKNRLDKTICEHQIFTVNCLENQIIKTALMQCSKYLIGIKNDDMIRTLNQNINYFELVDSIEVLDSEFKNIKHSPFYREYQDVLKLARMIFKRFGFVLESSKNNLTTKVPPFYINMPELFERFVEVKLRKVYGDKLLPGYGQNNGNSYTWGQRPDFIVKGEGLIIDAKYKYWFDNSDKADRFKDDYQQLSLYGRIPEIKELIGVKRDEEAKLIFIYPEITNQTELTEKAFTCEYSNSVFSNIIKIPIGIKVR
jgi:5-methylcytosine-specific restriction endonuclease McrBC regulatory subunit McrC